MNDELDESTIDTIESLLAAMGECFETRKKQQITMELSGPEMGDSIVITFEYKGNKHANNFIN